MGQNEIFDFFRADFLSTAVDQILFSAFHNVVARWMPPHQISRAVKAVPSEHPRIVLRNSKVSPQSIRTATAQLAHLPLRDIITVIIKQPHFVIRGDWAPYGFQR